MPFNDFLKLFNRAGMSGQYLVLSDGSYVDENYFKTTFQTGYDPTKVYASLMSNPNSTLGWKAIWDDLKAKGLIN